jgi:hypothetical protein
VSKLLAISLLLLLSPAIAVPAENPNSSAVQPQEYEVYSALIGSRQLPEGAKLLVVTNQTITDAKSDHDFIQAGDALTKRMPSDLQSMTVEDYLTKNQAPSSITDQLTLPIAYVLVDDREIRSLFAKGVEGWDDFNRKYPDSAGVIRLSRVGFNPNMDQALVYVTKSCGPLCGSGKYVFLVKDSNGWKVKKEFTVWVS